jgi:SAM-dependent methyltransferase
VDDSLRRKAQTARTEIQSGALRGAALLELVLSVPFVERDAFVDELLGLEPPPPDLADLPRGAVPYVPCSVEDILTTVREVPIRADDVLVDIGSGLGRVVILAHLLTGARARGIEIQEPLVGRARAFADGLGLSDVSFVHGNAAEEPLDGSVFFLYAPCNGEMLARVLDRLEEVARTTRIFVCAVALELRDVPWLEAKSTSSVSVTAYESCVPRPR